MLKRTPIAELTEGMILGRPIYKEDMSTLVKDGTVLTTTEVKLIRSTGIPAVYIIVEDEAVTQQASEKSAYDDYEIKVVPEKTPILDVDFTKEYKERFAELKKLYEQAESGYVDPAMAEYLATAIMPLAKGGKAVAHLHSLEQEGDYILHHCLHVAILAGLMGRWLHMPKLRQRELILAALFMDIGNVRIAPTVLNKPEKLEEEEWALMQRHVEFGYEIVTASVIGQNDDVANAILHHHERTDGSGYPNGLFKEQISEFARILSILDMYDAMASKRVYRKKRSPFEVFEILSSDMMDGKLDSDFGVKFIRRMCHSMHGNWVELTTGEKGKIIYIDESRIYSMPVVQTMSGSFVDLNRQSDIKINRILTSEEIE